MVHRKVLHLLFLALLFALLSWLLYRHTISLGSAFHHAWAQADRFSLALNFLHNGFDLFHPATHNLLTRDGITGVEFPIQNYLVAIAMKLTGSEAPVVFRSFVLLYSCLGLTFLYFLTLRITRSAAKAAMVVLLVFTAPVYTYYQANFLPSAHSFATALAGYYFFYNYRKQGRQHNFYLAVLLLTLAAASRAPFAIFLIATLAHQALFTRWTWPNILRNGLTYAAAFGFLLGYFLYNEYLNKVYEGSMFLTRPMAFRSVQEAREITELVIGKWGPVLLSPPQWVFYLLVLILAAAFAWHKLRLARMLRHEFLVHFAIAGFGVLCYSVLMGRQFIDHDYYLIDSWLLPLVFLLIAALKQIQPETLWQKRAEVLVLLVFAALFVQATYKEQQRRYTAQPGDRGHTTHQNFQGAAAFLDSLNIGPDARMLVIDAYSFNLPLLLMKRKGYTLLSTSPEGIATALGWDYDYVVVQDTFYFSDVVTNYPLITEQLQPVGGNGRITVLRRNPSPAAVAGRWSTDMEGNLDQSTWSNQSTLQTEKAHSGSRSSRLGEEQTYSLTFNKTAQEMNLKKGQRLIISGQVYWKEYGFSAQLVASLEHQGHAYLWQATDLSKITTDGGRWNKISLLVDVPEIPRPDAVVKVYLMKNGGQTLYLDDLEITVMQDIQ